MLKHVAARCSNKVVIAKRLLISEATVKGHVRNILSKLSASDRTRAVTIALRRGYFELEWRVRKNASDSKGGDRRRGRYSPDPMDQSP